MTHAAARGKRHAEGAKGVLEASNSCSETSYSQTADCNCRRHQRDYYTFVRAITMADPSAKYEMSVNRDLEVRCDARQASRIPRRSRFCKPFGRCLGHETRTRGRRRFTRLWSVRIRPRQLAN